MSPYVRPAMVRLGDRLCARSVLLLALGLFTATFVGSAWTTEAELDFQTTRAIASSGSVVLGDTPEASALVEDGLGVTTSVGEPRSERPIGAPVTAVVPYLLGTLAAIPASELEERHTATSGRTEYIAHLAVAWVGPLLAALLCWLVVLSALRVGVPRPFAWLAGVALGLTTYLWPSATASTADSSAAFFLFGSVHLLLRVRERFVRLLRPLRIDLLGFGACLSLTVLTRPDLWGAALVVAAAFVVSVVLGYRRLARFALFLRKTWRVGHWMDMALAAIPVVAGFGALLWTDGVPALVRPGDNVVEDVALHLVSPGRGLLWFAPLALLAPLGFAVARHRGSRLWPITVVGVVLWVVFASHRPLDPSASWGFGPGRLLPALAPLWLAVALALESVARSPVRRVFAGLLAVLGLTVNVAGVLVSTHAFEDLAAQELALDPSEAEIDETAYRSIAWSARHAQPWVHWRILRHRLALERETFDPRAIFFSDEELGGDLVPRAPRSRGFEHLAWVDLRDRLGRRPYPPILFAVVLLATGAVLAVRGLDRAHP